MRSRFYINGDENEIVRLHNTVFNSKLDIATWKWWNIDNPDGPGVSRTMWYGGRAIGHYATVPREINVMGTKHKAAMVINVMTHPDFRGEGIFSKLADIVFKRCEKEGCELVYGFPNNNVYDAYLRYFGWIGFGKPTTWSMDIDNVNLTKIQLLPTELVNSLPISYINTDRVWKDFIMIPRNLAYLNWRYGNRTEYKIIQCKYEDIILGVMVLKLYQNKIGHIIDISIENRILTKDIYNALIYHALTYFKNNGITKITCWFPKNSEIACFLENTGFSKSEWSTYFGVKLLKPERGLRPIYSQKDNWWITMGDSDVF